MDPFVTISIIEDDRSVAEAVSLFLESRGLSTHVYHSADEFLPVCEAGIRGCVIADVRLPGISGLDLLRLLREGGYSVPVVIMTAHGDVPMAVRAFKDGALDFIEKPFEPLSLLATVREALEVDAARHARGRHFERQLARLALLTPRERQILHLIVEGRYNKVIAQRLDVSVSTVEAHRKQIRVKLRARSLYDLVKAAELDREVQEQGMDPKGKGGGP